MRERLGSLLTPFRIALVYLAFGTAALLFSDVVLVHLVANETRLHELQAIKGQVEVGVTALLIYGLVSVYQRATEEQTREVERARDRLAFLNNLLRHHVLNRMNVVQGHVDELLDREEADRERLVTIRHQSDAVVDLVENVRALSGPSAAGFDPHPVDVSAVLESELDRFRTRYPDASVTGTVPPGLPIEADDSLALVFEQLLDNAVEHNDSPDPRVEVVVEEGDERVAVRVVDNGPGIPADALAGPPESERRGNEAMGLFLVRTLVDRYGGHVRVGGDDVDGEVVVVELRRADAG